MHTICVHTYIHTCIRGYHFISRIFQYLFPLIDPFPVTFASVCHRLWGYSHMEDHGMVSGPRFGPSYGNSPLMEGVVIQNGDIS